ncbi:MAG: acyltransferase family protein [Rhodococcus sp. (in: high G+C Gram-positive bacteria)]
MHSQYSPAGTSLDPSPTTTDRRVAIRTDLDGLRGVAIALVVVFHIWMGRVSGGVDVFLTLSGFFFTASLIRTARSGGSLDPFARMGRIVRRLGPPLVLVATAIAVATIVVLPRTRWVDVGNQLVSGLLFYANWELAWTAQDYLAADPNVSPVQHIWSVAVQFQFYLLAIAVVFGLAALVRRSRGLHRTGPHPHLFLVLFGGGAVLSFVYAADGGARMQAWNYYDTGARLWEILLGAAVAAYLAGRASRTQARQRAVRAGRTALAAAGLAAIVGCGFVLDGVHEFPGPWALVPVLATLALILAGPNTPIARMLGADFGRWLGSIAFPLYLWHWPILILTLAYTGAPSADLTTGLAIIAVSIGLATLTVRLVEKPMQAPPRSVSRVAVTATALGLAVIVVGSTVAWDQHVQRSVSELQAGPRFDPASHPGALELTDAYLADDADLMPALFAAPEDLPVTTLDGCIADFDTEDALRCEYGDLTADRTVVLAGGSHAEHWITALDVIGRDNGFRVVTYLKMGCPLMVGHLEMYGDGDFSGCPGWARTVLDIARDTAPDFVFTTATRPREGAPGDYTPDWYVDVWSELASYGIPVLAVRDNPWLERDGVAYRAIDCLADGGNVDSCGVERDLALDSVNPTLAASFRLPGVRPLDLTTAFCGDSVCRVAEGNVLIYRDEHHLTSTYVRTLTSELGRQLSAATGWW